MLGPRLVVAGTHSGVGKTTVATGILRALADAGHRPTSAKVGPDFIDPGYHAVASGGRARNLDPWMCGSDAMRPLAARAAAGGDVLVIEGVMGLFDGAADGTASSTADVARLLDSPVVLVVDAAAMSGSVAALVHGFATLDPSVRVAGVVLNRVGSDSHASMLRDALATVGVPVVGELRRDDRLVWRDRHLGLVPVAEAHAEVSASLDVLGRTIAGRCDLAALLGIARSAPDLRCDEVLLPSAGSPVRVAVATGQAFSFLYEDTLDALHAAGAEVVPFDPLHDERLPDALDGLVVGGGFPEAHAPALSANRSLLADTRARIAGGLVTWAECGGLLWLATSLDGSAMVGAVAAEATMTDRLTLGYREVRTRVASPLGPVGTRLRGHEFHYSRIDPGGEAFDLAGRSGSSRAGFATPGLVASYVHHHPGGDPSIVASFVARSRAASLGHQ